LSRSAFRGICQRCINATWCTFPRDSRRPVQSCEEFCEPTGAVTRTEQERREEPHGAARGGEKPEAATAATLMGLCRDCIHSDLCQFAKPEGGVWHCEEFE
jgi:hypothetical protein